jgi:predicted DNA-binding ribbon-helix-helix protein
MSRQEWQAANMATLSARVHRDFYDRLRKITEAEEVSIHRLIINLLTRFMDEYEKED